ncbi:MAG TPA: VOC family protein [Chloroflexota bacterium]|jgi:catechol 2,3-dioxygenase-like lactoylglutathione lyase family enzyme|nr:VOC family protein [Chloroflexota bacterium]
MSKVARLGHVGISVRDLDKMTRFYTDVLGLKLTDGGGPDARIVFLSADPELEQHEFVLSANPDVHANAQQISFTVGSLDDLRELHRAITAHPESSDMRVVNHGIAIGCYFRDPEQNHVEVYWPTGMDYVQPVAERVNLEAMTNDDVVAAIEAMPPRASTTPRYYGRDNGKRLAGSATAAS